MKRFLPVMLFCENEDSITLPIKEKIITLSVGNNKRKFKNDMQRKDKLQKQLKTAAKIVIPSVLFILAAYAFYKYKWKIQKK